MPHVYRRFSSEGKAGRHVSAQEEGPTIPHFNPFDLSDQKMWVKMIHSKKFGGLCDMWRLSGIFMMRRRP